MTGIGVQLPVAGFHPSVHGLRAMAELVEDEGAHSVWVSDHILMVDEAASKYPGNDDGSTWWNPEDDWYESMTSCGYLAAVTSEVRIGPGVLILPQRNVLEVAKQVATLDQLSHGRFVLGVGIGWSREEIEALGYPFGSRAGRMAEMLQVLRDARSGRPQEFHGVHVDVPAGVILEPRPVQRDGVPLIVGGEAPVALQRAAALGDGWLALAKHQYGPFPLAPLADGIATIRGHRDSLGLDAPFQFVLRLVRSRPESLPELPALIDDLAALGFDEVVIQPPWDDLTKTRRWIRHALSSASVTPRSKEVRSLAQS
ncbi:MAG: Hydride transferase 1 [Frankiales bacterium]|nr:Hydride transferase 1 [Frankiales bacterium]